MVPPYGDQRDIQTGRSPIIGIGIAYNVFKKIGEKHCLVKDKANELPAPF
jgi:hypothetical protein